MNPEILHSDTLYQALIDRNPEYDGRAYVGVHTTGIFCRLTCPARKPKRENVEFFATSSDCLEAGFRPCKRCRPMSMTSTRDSVVTELMARLEADPGYRWSERTLKELGYDPSTVRRAFQRHYGQSFLSLARLYRIGTGARLIEEGNRVIDAQVSSGFESESGFRSAFARLTGISPSASKENAKLSAHWIETPIGPLFVVADSTHLHLLEFTERKALPTELRRLQEVTRSQITVGRTPITERIAEEIRDYFSGASFTFTTPVAHHGSAFQKHVWDELRAIPPGETRTYGQIAAAVGKPTGSRAAASANGANQIAIVIPCHRVIGADGALTGYGGGLWRKKWLIEHERGR